MFSEIATAIFFFKMWAIHVTELVRAFDGVKPKNKGWLSGLELLIIFWTIILWMSKSFRPCSTNWTQNALKLLNSISSCARVRDVAITCLTTRSWENGVLDCYLERWLRLSFWPYCVVTPICETVVQKQICDTGLSERGLKIHFSIWVSPKPAVNWNIDLDPTWWIFRFSFNWKIFRSFLIEVTAMRLCSVRAFNSVKLRTRAGVTSRSDFPFDYVRFSGDS